MKKIKKCFRIGAAALFDEIEYPFEIEAAALRMKYPFEMGSAAPW
jgi:hypothetical protein